MTEEMRGEAGHGQDGSSTGPRMNRAIRAISDVPYGPLIDAQMIGRATNFLSLVRSTLTLCLQSHRNDLVITSQGARTVGGLIALSAYLALTRQKKLVLVEFLPGRRPGLAALAYRRLLPAVVARAQVMTQWELVQLAELYGLRPEQMEHIPFYSVDDRLDTASYLGDGTRSGVMSSGRNSCDWPTLIAAADGQDWDLQIICGDDEAVRIRPSASRSGVAVSGRVPRRDHDESLARASLFILSLTDSDKSAGHIRLMSAATFGTPVIATASPGIRGYEHLAVAVTPVGDPLALRAAVDTLLNDREELDRRSAEVSARARARPYSRYAEDLRAFFERGASHR
ncbi:glycosyltransferase [Rathayibacter sp. VKM Ac-2928]|uniref:glycosyltransferase n=1 Tax=Rathayibacter sp. VKM Ac-2928 TaxID=2929479 RepID=UPI001FB1B66C|nr:glycosyltransferase [Rathayibacter sp. VKM Ac-2928]MCJ1682415.1 glycosyltransferase [Rathayibacter sp. VKM Ac-2928]